MRVQADEIRRWIRADFDVELASMEPVGLGSDTAAMLWRGFARDGTVYAIKWTTGGSTAGYAISSHLAGLGIGGIVAPAHTVDGRPWSQRGGRPLVVTPWLSGDRAVEHRMDQQQWTSYGALLARIHAAPRPEDPLPAEDYTHHEVTSATSAVDRELRTHRARDHIVQDLATQWQAGLGGRIRWLLDCADELAAQLRAEPPPQVLCHGDPHLGNVLLVDGRPWLLDWDDAMLAPPERDLVLLKGGMGGYGPQDPHEQVWFEMGYGSADVDPVVLAYYRCTRAVEDVVYFAQDILDLDRRPAERADLMEIIRGVAGPTGLVRCAVSSLRGLGRRPRALRPMNLFALPGLSRQDPDK
jgi:spectinomycin phosphotransferase